MDRIIGEPKDDSKLHEDDRINRIYKILKRLVTPGNYLVSHVNPIQEGSGKNWSRSLSTKFVTPKLHRKY